MGNLRRCLLMLRSCAAVATLITSAAMMIELLEESPMSIPALAMEICGKLRLELTQDILNMTQLFIDQGQQNKLIAGFLSNN